MDSWWEPIECDVCRPGHALCKAVDMEVQQMLEAFANVGVGIGNAKYWTWRSEHGKDDGLPTTLVNA
jgi:hypothetical protein